MTIRNTLIALLSIIAISCTPVVLGKTNIERQVFEASSEDSDFKSLVYSG